MKEQSQSKNPPRRSPYNATKEPQLCNECCEEAEVVEDLGDFDFPTDQSLKAMEITTSTCLAVDEMKEAMIIQSAMQQGCRDFCIGYT